MMIDPRDEEKAVLKRLALFSRKLELLIIELEAGGQIELTGIQFKWEAGFNARRLDLRAIAKKMITQKLMANTQLISYEPING